MEENNYSKKKNVREELHPIPVKTKVKNTNEIPHFDIPIEYSKQDGEKSSKFIVIISGGEVRELNYFKFFKKPCYHRLRIFTVSDKGGIETKLLVEKANNVFDELSESNNIIDPDSYFLITDRDHYFLDIINIKPICDEKGYNLIICNPCFEIWIYYSFFKEHPLNSFNYSGDIRKLSNAFKTFLGKITAENGFNYKTAPSNIEMAINNSQKNYNCDENNIPVIYSTNMHNLAIEILKFCKEELEENKIEIERKKLNYLN